jgi:hypothetical protein
MNPKQLSELSDHELLEYAKHNKPSPIIDAFFIGFLVGIIIYSVAANTYGLITLIPLFLIYIFLKKPKRYQALKNELKRRNLE